MEPNFTVYEEGPSVLLRVGAQIAENAARVYGAEGCADCPTLAAALGALTGEAALFATMRDLPFEGWINSSMTNDLIYGRERPGRPSLWGYIRAALVNQYCARPGALPNVETVAARVQASVGLQPFPALNAPPGYEPLCNPLEAGPRLRVAAQTAARQWGVGPLDSCYALAEATILIIAGHRDVTPAPISTRLALEAMMSAARIAPAPVWAQAAQ